MPDPHSLPHHPICFPLFLKYCYSSAHPFLHSPSWITHSDLVSDVTSSRKPSQTSSYFCRGPSSGSQSILTFLCHSSYHQVLNCMFTCHCPLLGGHWLNNGYVSFWFTPSLKLEEEITEMDILKKQFVSALCLALDTIQGAH